MTDSKTRKDILEEFCVDWNRRSLYPKLYPVHMVPESFAVEVAKAQIDAQGESAIELPDDVQDAEQFLQWARSFEQESPKNRHDIVPLQVAAVDRQNRVAVFATDIDVGPNGYADVFTQIKIETILTGFSRRKAWIDPKMLGDYDKYVSGASSFTHIGDHAKERMKLFQKSLQAMIKAKLKDVQERMTRDNKKAEENDLLQEVIEDIKAEGIPLKELVEDKVLQFDTIVDGKGAGILEFKTKGFTCMLTTQSSKEERKGFSAMLKIGVMGK